MTKIVKAIKCSVILCFVLCVFSGCFLLHYLYTYKGYQGEHEDLYTVAVNNVFGAQGHISNGEISGHSQICILDTDAYGRTLFLYSEYCATNSKEHSMAFVIMQKSEDGYVYYYPDRCYIPYFGTTDNWEQISMELDEGYFDQLKEENDWNQEWNEEKTAKTKISNKKPEGSIHIRSYKLDDIIYSYEVRNGHTGRDDSFSKYSIFCEKDRFGRELYYVSARSSDFEGVRIYAVILNKDGTCQKDGIVRIETLMDSAEAIAGIKRACNWNISE